MEVESPRHSGASTIGSQLLDETAPMASKSWQPSHEPPEGKKGTRHTDIVCHTDIVYTVEKGRRVGGRENPETMLKRRMALQQTRGIRVHVDNRRLLIAQAYRRWLHACTGAYA